MTSFAEQIQEPTSWYNQLQNEIPFSLSKKISSLKSKSESLYSIAPFPWNLESATTLWDGVVPLDDHQQVYVEPHLSNWREMLSEFSDAVAVGSQDNLTISFVQQKRQPICVKLPPDSNVKLRPTDCMSIAWILGKRAPFEPLVVFSHGSVAYIYNVRRKGVASYLRGHGGTITSIAVHPTRPNLFCTTSKDTSTRIYDLSLEPQKHPQNPHWPPSKKPSLAGAAHGLHAYESEGRGLGRCIIVLMGGRSGGHLGAVLGAAFHPTMPIIATCGLDRAVKIWLVPPISQAGIKREDKPLFSSARIHTARVLSITWLRNDVLATHSAPAVMRVDPVDVENKKMQITPGEFIIWRWLGLDRFFPADQEETRHEQLRGCSSDYQESSSFKIISVTSFPPAESQHIVPKLNIFQSPVHEPVAVYTFPQSSSCFIFNVCDAPRGNQSSISKMFAGNSTTSASEVLAQETERIHLDDDALSGANPVRIPSDKDKGIPIHPPVPGRELSLAKMASRFEVQLHNCMFAMDGSVLTGVSKGGTLWVWRLNDSNNANDS